MNAKFKVQGASLAAMLTLLAAAVAGCAGWKPRVDSASVSSEREARAADAIRNFEQQRDAAQLAAALDRWRQGDAARAETMIATLIARRPDFVEARLRLAEILWSRGDPSAESHYRTVLAAEPSRAEAHHGLGLVLDATGRADEAQACFAKAAELEPGSEVYRLTAGD
jgi:Tfp pilus assembly protein PilF